MSNKFSKKDFGHSKNDQLKIHMFKQLSDYVLFDLDRFNRCKKQVNRQTEC